MRPLYLNGRVLARDHGGVRRYATEIANRLAACEVVRPDSARYPWSARVWEQTTLARTCADGVLLNVAHSGPLRHSRHIVVVHDLLALTAPRSVDPAYAALLRFQLPRLVRSADKVVAVSRSVADQLGSMFGVGVDRIEIVPPGIADVFGPGSRTAARTRLGLAVDRPVVAALLDPTPRKNSGAVQALLQHVKAERPDVQVAAAGSLRAPAFARRGKARRVPLNVLGFDSIDLGHAADIELAALYQAADIFVSLTQGEGFGLPMVEAAFSGAAVITTAVPSILEHAPQAAVVVSHAGQAYAALVALLDDPARRAELADNAHQALGDLRWARTAATLGLIADEVRGK